jgi:CBS domain containing-hemolysin-like protein
MEHTLVFDLLGLVAVGVLVLANSFFVAAEFSLVSVRRTRILELVEKGDSKADNVLKAINNPDRVIAATQLGITLASLGLGWIGEPALSSLFLPIVELFPIEIQSEVSHTIAAVASFAIITFMHVVVGELAPKSIALQNPEGTSLQVAGPTLWTETLFKPAIWALNGTGNYLLKLVGIEPASGHELVHSVEEIKMLVQASSEGGVLDQDEKDMLHAVIDFSEMMVRHVMIPRTEVIAVEADMHMQEIVELVVQSTLSKFPVYDDDLDNILGVVHINDLLKALQTCEGEQCLARDFVQEPVFVPETTPMSTLLRMFRAKRQHIAIVLDEYGGTAGLVTLEDVLEEIVGEISDPFDREVPEIFIQEDGSVQIDGLVQIEVVNEQLNLDLADPAYDTIAGYIMGRLGRIPKVGDKVETEQARFVVQEMDGRRIAQVGMELKTR